MKICMIGLGSIGKKHLKNLTPILAERNEAFQIDALRSRNCALEEDVRGLVTKEYHNLNDLPDDYDIIFITNPTSRHYDTIKEAVLKTKHMFIEKPVFDHLGYNMEAIPFKEQGVYYVACPLRYTRVVQWLKNYVLENKIYAGRAICSTYLPDWRPGTDYRMNYSARKELGGGVSIDLIHEWDYIVHLFGAPNRVLNFQGTYSDLEITSDDLSVYIGQYDDKLVSVHLDYFGRFNKREIELYTRDDVIVGDLIKNQIHFLRSAEVIDLHEERDEYHVKELEYFLGIIDGKYENHNCIETAIKVLSITKGDENQ